MDKSTPPAVYEAALQALERQILELSSLCEQLSKEKASLKHQLKTLQNERGNLIERHELAKHRVEAMIARLKNMEEST